VNDELAAMLNEIIAAKFKIIFEGLRKTMKNLRLSIFRAGIKETETSHLRKMAIT
jgi:hypothetical protein